MCQIKLRISILGCHTMKFKKKKKKEADIFHVKMYCIQKIQKKNNANAYLFIISRILCLINFKRYPRRFKWKPFEHTQIPLSPFDIGISSSLLSVFAIVLKQGALSNSHVVLLTSYSARFISQYACAVSTIRKYRNWNEYWIIAIANGNQFREQCKVDEIQMLLELPFRSKRLK